MGMLVEGQWQNVWYDTKSTGGHFKRDASRFRNWITPDGSAGPSGQAALRQKRAATTFMYHSPVPGRTAR